MRISRADAYKAVDIAAANIAAAAKNGRTSRAAMETALKGLTGTEKALTETLFKWIDHRDGSHTTVTKTDLAKQIPYAKEKLIAAYDLNGHGLSKKEVSNMKVIGHLAVQLAKELKGAGTAGGAVSGGEGGKVSGGEGGRISGGEGGRISGGEGGRISGGEGGGSYQYSGGGSVSRGE